MKTELRDSDPDLRKKMGRKNPRDRDGRIWQ